MNEIQATANAVSESAKTGRTGLKLIDRVLGPMTTRRQSEADAQAKIHAALANRVVDYIESNPLDPTVLDLVITCGGKASVVNLANILLKADTMVDDTADLSLVSDDWIANWRDKARIVADEEMATLWAQLLAGEINAPGTYSPKAVNMLADMDRSDAELFSNLCRFQVIRYEFEFGPRDNLPLVIDPSDEIYTSNGVTEEGLLALEDIGLIKYPLIPNLPGRVKGFAYSRGWVLNYSADSVETGRVSWSYNGKQMSKLCLPLESPSGFEYYLLDKWGEAGRDIRHHADLTVHFNQGILRADPRSATVSWQGR